jgi:hypothetical protein
MTDDLPVLAFNRAVITTGPVGRAAAPAAPAAVVQPAPWLAAAAANSMAMPPMRAMHSPPMPPPMRVPPMRVPPVRVSPPPVRVSPPPVRVSPPPVRVSPPPMRVSPPPVRVPPPQVPARVPPPPVLGALPPTMQSPVSENRRKCASTRLLGGSRVISQAELVETVKKHTLSDFEPPDAATLFTWYAATDPKPADKASQINIIRALLGCSDVGFVQGNVLKPTRGHLIYQYGIDRKTYATVCKNMCKPSDDPAPTSAAKRRAFGAAQDLSRAAADAQRALAAADAQRALAAAEARRSLAAAAAQRSQAWADAQRAIVAANAQRGLVAANARHDVVVADAKHSAAAANAQYGLAAADAQYGLAAADAMHVVAAAAAEHRDAQFAAATTRKRRRDAEVAAEVAAAEALMALAGPRS